MIADTTKCTYSIYMNFEACTDAAQHATLGMDRDHNPINPPNGPQFLPPVIPPLNSVEASRVTTVIVLVTAAQAAINRILVLPAAASTTGLIDEVGSLSHSRSNQLRFANFRHYPDVFGLISSDSSKQVRGCSLSV